MARLTLRVPDEVYQQIQERARLNRRSINSQIIHDLEEANALETNEQQEYTNGVWLRNTLNNLRSESMNLGRRSSSHLPHQDQSGGS